MTPATFEQVESREAVSRETVSPFALPPTAAALDAACARLRDAARATLAPSRIADAIARVVALWRDRNYRRRIDAVARIASGAGFSIPLMNESLDALLRPFTPHALQAIASRAARRETTNQFGLLGFIMAGNVAGAGLHEVAIALISGAAMLIKTASNEPIFFAEFVRTLAETDPEIGARIAVFTWPRGRSDLTSTIVAGCDRIVAYGDDATIESLQSPKLIGFGSRVSGAVIFADSIAPSMLDHQLDLLARDVVYFEQLGCLSPHHVFVLTENFAVAHDFAKRISAAVERLCKSMPPARIPLIDAAKVFSVRENARWRALAGDRIALFEGPGLQSTTIFDPAASFSVSPGFRTIFVSAVRDLSEVRERLAPVKGLIEAFGLCGNQSVSANFHALANELDISYVAQFGEMQSPPLDWRHGGGAFLDVMIGPR
jgi:hypothetical protein